VTWAVSRLEGVKGGARGDMWLECTQEQTYSILEMLLRLDIGR